MKSLFTAFSLLLVMASPALAQSAGFVRGFGGVSFFTEPGALVGATVGIRITDALAAIGDVGRMTNILPRSIQRDVDLIAQEIGDFFGAPVTIDLEAPALYTFGGLRFSHALSSGLRVFAEGGAGIARGTSDITARVGSTDVSPQVTDLLQLKESATEPLLALGGGLWMALSDHLSADVGYRYFRIFTDDPRIDTGTLVAGLNWSF